MTDFQSLHFQAASKFRQHGIEATIFRATPQGAKIFTVVIGPDDQTAFQTFEQAVSYLHDRASSLPA